ncbi:MAG TPA: hypothetical protein VHM65_08785, partial [Candidatus Lustribacter sp.]|nr:hypothetical protein [Candidatus Lustribacter sp.]
VTNNSDRKGSHVVRDAAGRLWGFDHGVSFHVEPKLRTVLWGWAGQPLTPADLERLGRLDEALADAGSRLHRDLLVALPREDVGALTGRVRRLLATGVHPAPTPGWPSIPWPAL